MTWLSNNWIWLALGLGFIAFHFFGHRHGGHHHAHRTDAADAGADSRSVSPEAGNGGKGADDQRSHRHHRC